MKTGTTVALLNTCGSVDEVRDLLKIFVREGARREENVFKTYPGRLSGQHDLAGLMLFNKVSTWSEVTGRNSSKHSAGEGPEGMGNC